MQEIFSLVRLLAIANAVERILGFRKRLKLSTSTSNRSDKRDASSWTNDELSWGHTIKIFSFMALFLCHKNERLCRIHPESIEYRLNFQGRAQREPPTAVQEFAQRIPNVHRLNFKCRKSCVVGYPHQALLDEGRDV